jgi:hypothetical protein
MLKYRQSNLQKGLEECTKKKTPKFSFLQSPFLDGENIEFQVLSENLVPKQAQFISMD